MKLGCIRGEGFSRANRLVASLASRYTARASLTASSEPVKLARAVHREAKLATSRFARVSPSPRMHPSFMAAWRYAAREVGHKAAQWLYLWQVARLVRVDRGPAAALADQGAALLEDIRRCMREFKRAIGPTLAPSGLEEELDVHFGAEARLIRRIVRTLRTKQPRVNIRAELAEMLALPIPGTGGKE